MKNHLRSLRESLPKAHRAGCAARLLAACGALALALHAPAGRAQQAPDAVTKAVQGYLERETRGLPGQVRITVSPLDARNRLPTCAALVPFLPAGTRAWGQISVGVRCDSPVAWTAYLQAHVAVMGDHLVTKRPLRAAQIVGPEDIDLRQGDLTALPDNTLTDASQAVGHHTRYAIAAGLPLRGEMLRVPPAVLQGQSVRVISAGPGFRVSSEGQALNNASPGEPVRVRMANGQVVTGTARTGGNVEIAF